MKLSKAIFCVVILFSGFLFPQDFKEADVVFLLGGPDEAYGSEIHAASDLNGNVFATGKFKGEAVVTSKHREKVEGEDVKVTTTIPLTSKGVNDIFLAKYDKDGILIWALSMGAAGDDIGKGIACNSAGDVIITGTFQGTVDFNGISLTSTTNANVFVAQFDTDGKVKWAIRGGGVTKLAVVEYGSGVAVDAADNVYVSGYFYGASEPPDYTKPGVASFGDYQIQGAVQANNSFAAKLSKTGKTEWVSCFGHYGEGTANAICVDGDGGVYVTGVCSATFVVAGQVKFSNGSVDIYVAKFNPDGSFGWFQQFGSGEKFNAMNAAGYKDPFESGTGICSDGAGNVFVTGQFFDVCSFGAFSLESEAGTNIFVLKMSNDGKILWASQTSGEYLNLAKAIAYDGKGSVYITGINSKYGGVDVEKDDRWVTVTDRGIGFIEKYNAADGKMSWGAGAGNWGLSLAANPAHEIHLFGSFADQVKFDTNSKLDIKVVVDTKYESGGWFGRAKERSSYIAGAALYMVKVVDE